METSKTLTPKGPDVQNPLRMTSVVRVQAAFRGIALAKPKPVGFCVLFRV